MTICDNMVVCFAQEGPGTECFCGVSISTLVDGDTAEGWGRHTATEGCFYKRGSSLIYMSLLHCGSSLQGSRVCEFLHTSGDFGEISSHGTLSTKLIILEHRHVFTIFLFILFD